MWGQFGILGDRDSNSDMQIVSLRVTYSWPITKLGDRDSNPDMQIQRNLPQRTLKTRPVANLYSVECPSIEGIWTVALMMN